MPSSRALSFHLAGLALFTLGTAQAAATFTAATPYLQASDNPYAGPFLYSHLETFEDGLLNTPGLSASGGVVAAPGALTDSVDADDGSIDGSGAAGRSWYSGNSAARITFSFSASVLGTLPTRVGVVFTDIGNRNDGAPNGFDTAVIEVFDGSGVSQGRFSFAFGDGSAVSSTAEDRFVGASFAGGIGSMTVGFEHSIDWEVDHVFYAAVPEPGAWALWAGGLAGLALQRHRR